MSLFSTSFIKRVLKFGAASGIATVVDFMLFRFVLYAIMPLFYAEILASFVGMIINFFIQKKYVFELKRSAVAAFVLSIATSIIIMLFGGFLITQLIKIPYLAVHISISKIIVMGIKFGLNFFTKHWVFGKRFIYKEG